MLNSNNDVKKIILNSQVRHDDRRIEESEEA